MLTWIPVQLAGSIGCLHAYQQGSSCICLVCMRERFAGRRLDMQAYIMFGDPSHLEMFTELYAAAMHHLQASGGGGGGGRS
jgi:hypothetical protein